MVFPYSFVYVKSVLYKQKEKLENCFVFELSSLHLILKKKKTKTFFVKKK